MMKDKRNQFIINILTWTVLLTPVWALLYGLYLFDHGWEIIAMLLVLIGFPIYICFIFTSISNTAVRDAEILSKMTAKYPNRNYAVLFNQGFVPPFLWFVFWIGFLLVSLTELLNLPQVATYWLNVFGILFIVASLALLMWFWAAWKRTEPQLFYYDSQEKKFGSSSITFGFDEIEYVTFSVGFLFFTSYTKIRTRYGVMCVTGRLTEPSQKDINEVVDHRYGYLVQDEQSIDPSRKTLRQFFLQHNVPVKLNTERYALYLLALVGILFLYGGDLLGVYIH